MSIEDRVRRVLEGAIAGEPPPRTAPLAAVRRRRRRRPVLAGAAAVVLILAAVLGLVAIRQPDRDRPLPSTVPTDGWTTFTDATANLRFRYPPDWRLERTPEDAPASYRLVPPELARAPERQRNLVYLAAGTRFWIGEDWFGTTSLGRLPGGQAYLRVDDIGDRFRRTTWSVDWGRPCLNDDRRCLPRSVRVDLSEADSRLWGRYQPVVATIVRTLAQLRPTAPSTGDASLPACQPGQWRLVWPEEYAGPRGEQGTAIQGGVQYLRGPRCHLRISVRLTVEDAGGQLLPVEGNPASMPMEMDLPIGGLPRQSGSWVIGVTPMWRFIWDEWCNRGLPRATLRLNADGGASIAVPGLDPAPAEKTFGSGCRDRGRRSTVAAWP